MRLDVLSLIGTGAFGRAAGTGPGKESPSEQHCDGSHRLGGQSSDQATGVGRVGADRPPT